MSLEQELVDLVADDLVANAGLDARTVVRYRRPRALLPEDCPCLVVALVSGTPVARTTITHTNQWVIQATWHVETVEEASTLVDDEEKAVELLDGLAAIRSRFRVLSAGSVEHANVDEIVPGGTVFIPALDTGLVEGYATEVLITATEGTP